MTAAHLTTAIELLFFAAGLFAWCSIAMDIAAAFPAIRHIIREHRK